MDLLTANDDGATHTFTLDGSAAGAANIVGAAGGVSITPSVLRIPGVVAGAHTVVGTISGLTGGTPRTQVVGWHYEDTPLPVIFCLKQPKCPTYSAFPSLGRPTDTSVGTVNTDMDTVAAAFDANVVTVDTDGVFGKQPGAFVYYDGTTSDSVHPGPYGHRIMSTALLSAILSHPSVARLEPVSR